MLKSYYSKEGIEAGVDECGRGCLCGPVVAGAVILPKDFTHPYINDSKKLSKSKMLKLELEIKAAAIDWNIALIHHEEIDEINIHHASIKAMHEALNE
jgi:ribonuclease HII